MLFEEMVWYFDDGRKWKERFIVIRACYVLEIHESYKVRATIHHLLTEAKIKCLPASHTCFPAVIFERCASTTETNAYWGHHTDS